ISGDTMAKHARQLTAADVLRKTAEAGRHAVGSGLYLERSPTGSLTWLLRHTRGGKPTWLSLGKADAANMGASLQDARERARDVFGQLADGIAPTSIRRAARVTGGPVGRTTTAAVIDAYIRARQPGWTNPDYSRSTEQYLRTWTAAIG